MRWSHPVAEPEPSQAAAAPADVPDETTFAHCDIQGCHRAFRSVQGLRQHLRLAHPEQYNRSIDVTRKKYRWTPEEDLLLADTEARLRADGVSSTVINQAILEVLQRRGVHRTLEAVKSRRKRPDYKNMLEAASQRISASTDLDEEEDLVFQFSGSSSQPLQEAIEALRDELPVGNRLSEPLRLLVDAVLLGRPVGPLLEEFLQRYFVREVPTSAARRPGQPVLRSKRQQRRVDYATIQRLYFRNRRACAHRVLDGSGAAPSRHDVNFLAYWVTIFTSPVPDASFQAQDSRCRLEGVWDPITVEDVNKGLPQKRTAPGPDGFPVEELCKTPRSILALLLNLVLLNGKPTPYLLQSRVTFVPKTQAPTSPAEYRPIAVAPVLLRLLHRILSKRLSAALPLDARQRGFIDSDGCGENLLLLRALLAEARRTLKPLYLASLDLRKAFDTVSTPSIMAAASRLGFPPQLRAYLQTLYDSGTMTLTSGPEKTEVCPTRGVRQGDPLSPYIFNSVVDEYLATLPEAVGFSVGEERTNALAFADDLVLVASTPQGLQLLLDQAENFFTPRGLTFGVSKCSTLSLVPSGRDKKMRVDNRVFRLGGVELPASGCTSSWRYLGVDYGSRGPLVPARIGEMLAEHLLHLSKAPLKPQQRLHLLGQYLLPRFYHGLTFGRLSLGLLRQLDLMVRGAVRKWLHLPHDAPTAFFHASVPDGGLGIPSMLMLIPRLKLDRYSRLQNSEVPLFRNVLQVPALQAELSNVRRALTVDGNQLLTKQRQRTYWARQLYRTFDGRGLKEAKKVPFVHGWVADGGRLLSGSAYMNAIRVRINALPTRSRVARGRQLPRDCRAGCLIPGSRQPATETLTHIAQHCQRAHGLRVRRHDAILAKTCNRLHQKGWTVTREPVYVTSDGRRKPDIVLHRGDQSAIVDVQVVAGSGSLVEAHRRKTDYYSTREVIQQVQGGRAGAPLVTSLTVTYRGVWCVESAADLLDLGLTRSDLKIIAVSALEGTARIWRAFNSSTVRTDGGHF